jgi:hypothetical protein
VVDVWKRSALQHTTARVTDGRASCSIEQDARAAATARRSTGVALCTPALWLSGILGDDAGTGINVAIQSDNLLNNRNYLAVGSIGIGGVRNTAYRVSGSLDSCCSA